MSACGTQDLGGLFILAWHLAAERCIDGTSATVNDTNSSICQAVVDVISAKTANRIVLSVKSFEEKVLSPIMT